MEAGRSEFQGESLQVSHSSEFSNKTNEGYPLELENKGHQHLLQERGSDKQYTHYQGIIRGSELGWDKELLQRFALQKSLSTV